MGDRPRLRFFDCKFVDFCRAESCNNTESVTSCRLPDQFLSPRFAGHVSRLK